MALELDHAIAFVPARDAIALPGFVIEPGRIHTGQGTRNVRVVFEHNYLEVVWIEHPDEVAARGLDFIARCDRPASAVPFGCVLRGKIPDAARGLFRPYQLPDAPELTLQLLVDQPPDAPFVAVFEIDSSGFHPDPKWLAHANGATSITRATFHTPRVPRLPPVANVAFVAGVPGLDLELGSTRLVL